MQIRVKRVHPEAKLPTYGHTGDAGMDLYAVEDTVLEPGKPVRVRTGIAVEIPDGYVGLCWDKSGLATNHSLKTIAGVIDSTYRGEIMVGIMNLGVETYTFKPGEKVTQMLIQKVENADIVEVEELNETLRGEGGFGSTGK